MDRHYSESDFLPDDCDLYQNVNHNERTNDRGERLMSTSDMLDPAVRHIVEQTDSPCELLMTPVAIAGIIIGAGINLGLNYGVSYWNFHSHSEVKYFDSATKVLPTVFLVVAMSAFLNRWGVRDAIRKGQMRKLSPHSLHRGCWRCFPVKIRNLSIRSLCLGLQLMLMWIVFVDGGFALLCHVGGSFDCTMSGPTYCWYNAVNAAAASAFTYMIALPALANADWLDDGVCTDGL